MKQATNVVNVAGVLNEIDLTEAQDRNGKDYIRGKVYFLVDQTYGGKEEHEELQVDVFAYKKTSTGKDNPAYKSAKDLMENAVSVAACGSVNGADSYRIGGARITSNSFTTQDGRNVTYYPMQASFFNKISGDYTPDASFETEIFITNMKEETDREGMPTGRLVLSGAIVGYNDRIDVVPFVVEDPKAVAHISNNWGVGDTVRIYGKARSTVEIVTKAANEDMFGEAPMREYRNTRKEYVITSGSSTPYDSEIAYSEEDINAAMAMMKARAAATASTTSVEKKVTNRGF